MEWHVFQYDLNHLLISAARLLIACLLGGFIGFEREFSHHKPAGFRTHILVSLGSCLVMMISQFAISAYEGTAPVDPTRLGAQVVSGIGFLGAGAIIRHGVSVKGITTAASIWAVACVGLACGVGFYSAAVLATVLIWAVLQVLKVIEKKLQNKELLNIFIEVETDGNEPLSLEAELMTLGYGITCMDISRSTHGLTQKITCKRTGPLMVQSQDEMVRKVMAIKGVVRVTL